MRLLHGGIVVCVAILAFGAAANAQDERPYIGVSLDPSPLPRLLTLHLGLEPDQGIRVGNVVIKSPADEAGIERDDIIVVFQGKPVTDSNAFVEAVRGARVGEDISLEIVHVGKPKTVELTLRPSPEKIEWKYPTEPEVVTSWRPGRILRANPDTENWVEIPFDDLHGAEFDVRDIFKARYTFRHAIDGQEYTIVVDGDPQRGDTTVTIRTDNAEYTARVDELDTLPEAYREPAKQALAGVSGLVKQRIRISRGSMPDPPDPNQLRRYFRDLRTPRPDPSVSPDARDRVIESLEGRVERLQKQLSEMERRQSEMFDRLLSQMGTTKEQSGEPAAEPNEPKAQNSGSI